VNLKIHVGKEKFSFRNRRNIILQSNIQPLTDNVQALNTIVNIWSVRSYLLFALDYYISFFYKIGL